MKLHAFVLNGIILTAVSVGYVHQHAEIYKAGYEAQKSRRQLDHLIDRNCKLMYDLSKLESPRYLLASVSHKEMEFARNGRRQITRYHMAGIGTAGDQREDGFLDKFLDALIPRAEARPPGLIRQ